MHKLLIAAALAGTAAMLPVSGLASPAAAQSPASSVASAYKGVWTADGANWVIFDGTTLRAPIKVANGDSYATFLFDPARSTAKLLKGIYNAGGEVVDVEATLSEDGKSLMFYDIHGEAFSPYLMERVGGVGDQPAQPQALARSASMATVWSTPLGQMVVFQQGQSYAAYIKDSKTGAVRFRLTRNDDYTRSSRRGEIYWDWTDASEDKPKPHPMLVTVLSPDDQHFSAGYLYLPASAWTSASMIGGQTRWTASRYDAPPPSQGGTSPTPSETPASGGTPPAPPAKVPDGLQPLVGEWSGNNRDWIRLRVEDGALTGDSLYFKYNAQPPALERNGPVLVDQRSSSGNHVSGLRKWSSSVDEFDLTLSADRQALYGFVKTSDVWQPAVLHRSTGTHVALPDKPTLLRKLATVWDTPLGRLTISEGDERWFGEIKDPKSGKLLYSLRWLQSDGEAANDSIQWAWQKAGEAAPAEPNNTLLTALAPDGKTLLVGHAYDGAQGRKLFMGGVEKWTALPFGSVATPDQSGSGSGPGGGGTGGTGTGESGGNGGPAGNGSAGRGADSPGPGPQPGPSPMPSGDGSFRQLQKYDVRLDRVETPRDEKLVHVYLTLKNATQSQQYVTSGVVQVQVKDSDRVTKQSGQVLRPVAGPLQHFGSTPVLQPGEQLKVQFAFQLDAGASPSQVIVVEGDKRVRF